MHVQMRVWSTGGLVQQLREDTHSYDACSKIVSVLAKLDAYMVRAVNGSQPCS